MMVQKCFEKAGFVWSSRTLNTAAASDGTEKEISMNALRSDFRKITVWMRMTDLQTSLTMVLCVK